MIDPSKLTSNDVGRTVIFRNNGTGPAENAVVLGHSSKYIYIRVSGDNSATEASPNEVSWSSK